MPRFFGLVITSGNVGASRQQPEFPSWKNMAAEYDLEGKILQSVYLTVLATTGKQHFS